MYVLLQDKFSFIRNIISSIEHPIDSNSAIDSFCKAHETTSLAELKAFCLECGSDSIRYKIAYNYYLRINYDTFVHKNAIEFDVNAIDETIEKFTQSSYVSFSDVVLTSFPPSQYPWNIYLLESYLVSCSAKFTLAHERYNQDKVVGAIIKRTSHYDDYSSVITQILAESNINLNKTEALEYWYIGIDKLNINRADFDYEQMKVTMYSPSAFEIGKIRLPYLIFALLSTITFILSAPK